jgi:murein DD-endopeptidase MepM/ murein hydrolase activator NlpD
MDGGRSTLTRRRRPSPGRSRRTLLATTCPLLAAAPARAELAPDALAPPVSPACVSSPFGGRGSGAGGPRASRFHAGVDLPAPAGAWVRAAAAGRVAAIRRRGSAGLEVALRHPGGWVTRYAHLGAVAPALASGKRSVSQGEALGRVGRTGIAYGTHLHFELLVGGVPVDPAPHLKVERCGLPEGR